MKEPQTFWQAWEAWQESLWKIARVMTWKYRYGWLRPIACRLGLHHYIFIGAIPFGRNRILTYGCACKKVRLRGPVQ